MKSVVKFIKTLALILVFAITLIFILAFTQGKGMVSLDALIHGEKIQKITVYDARIDVLDDRTMVVTFDVDAWGDSEKETITYPANKETAKTVGYFIDYPTGFVRINRFFTTDLCSTDSKGQLIGCTSI